MGRISRNYTNKSTTSEAQSLLGQEPSLEKGQILAGAELVHCRTSCTHWTTPLSSSACFCLTYHFLLISQMKRSRSSAGNRETTKKNKSGVPRYHHTVQLQKRSSGWVEDRWRKHCASVELGRTQPLRNLNSFWPLIELHYVSSLHCISPLWVCLSNSFSSTSKRPSAVKRPANTPCTPISSASFFLPSIQTQHCPPSHQFSSLI